MSILSAAKLAKGLGRAGSAIRRTGAALSRTGGGPSTKFGAVDVAAGAVNVGAIGSMLADIAVDPIGNAWDGLTGSPVGRGRIEAAALEMREVEARKARAERLARLDEQNARMLATEFPDIYNQVLAGRRLPKGAVVIGGSPRTEKLEELVRMLSEGGQWNPALMERRRQFDERLAQREREMILRAQIERQRMAQRESQFERTLDYKTARDAARNFF